MVLNKADVFSLYEKLDSNITQAAKTWCKRNGVPYNDNMRKKFSRIVNEHKRKVGIIDNSEGKGEQEIKVDEDKGTMDIRAIYLTPPTSEQIIRDHKVDTNLWKLSLYWSKQVSNGYRVSALFSQKSQEDKRVEEFQKFLKNYKPSFKPIPIQSEKKSFNNKSCLVLSLADFHIGKLDREMIPIEDRLKHYEDTVKSLLRRSCMVADIEEICFVVGNDLFQTDSIRNETVKGTAVDTSMSWETSYEVAFKLLVETIQTLKQYCKKLTVVYVAGNHSASKEYYITHALEVMFRGDKNIKFNRTSDKYKCFVYGNTALFFNHGDNINDRLPLLFAQTFSKEWGMVKYKEIILGDKHHNSEKTFMKSQGESQGIRMRILPSLAGTDQWHYDKCYTNGIQAGIGLVYDKEKGKFAEFEHRI